MVRALVCLAALFFSACGASSACSSATDGKISIAVADHVELGTFTRPDLGPATLTLSPDGTRALPPELKINDPSKDSFRPARAEITGGPGCRFRITISAISGDLSGVRLFPGSGYTLSSATSGAEGELDALGRFQFAVGVSATVEFSRNQPVGGSITIEVSYI